MSTASRIDLLMCLATTKELLRRSTAEGWPDESPDESSAVVKQLIERLFAPGAPLPRYWEIQFLPAGPIQEIAMANGWHGAYGRLSELWDANYQCLLEEPDQAGTGPEGNCEHKAQ